MDDISIAIFFTVSGIVFIVMYVYDIKDKETYRSSVEAGSPFVRIVMGGVSLLVGLYYLYKILF